MDSREDYEFLDKLKVTVIEAKDIKETKSGAPSPYIYIEFKGKSERTKVLSESTHPKWNPDQSCYLFDLNEDDMGENGNLVLTCYSHHQLSKDEFLGCVKIQLNSSDKIVDKWYPLQPNKKHTEPVTGELRVIIELVFTNLHSEEGQPVTSGARSKFFSRFPSVPTSEKILQMFHCARQTKTIPLQGHLFLLEHYLCFYSNILVKKKKTIIKLEDISNISPKKSAHLVPNAIEIITNDGKKFFFESFMHRNKTYESIYGQWKKSIGGTVTPRRSLTSSMDSSEDDLRVTPVKIVEEVVEPVNNFTEPLKRGHRRTHSETPTAQPPGSDKKKNISRMKSFAGLHDIPPNTAPQMSPRELSLQIVINDYKDFQCNKMVTIETFADRPVQSVLNKLVQHGIPDKELIEFSLFLPKGRAFSKVELDPIQPLSFYEIKDKDILKLKKKKERFLHISRDLPSTTKTVQIQVENFEQIKSNRTITLTIPSQCSVQVILEKLLSEVSLNVNLTELVNYTLFVPKLGTARERGILVENTQWTTSQLGIEDKGVLFFVRKTPLRNFYEKFDITVDKSYEEIAFEVCANCILSPMLGTPRTVIPEDKAKLMNHIGEFFSMQSKQQQTITRIKSHNIYSKEGFLLELVHRLCLLDSHPWYNEEAFEDHAKFMKWRTTEYESIKKLVQTVVFDHNFVGILNVKVREAKNLAPQNKSGTADSYLSLQLDEKKFKTKTQKKQLHPTFDEDFQFEVTGLDKILKISLFAKSDFGQTDAEVGEIEIPISELAWETKHDIWKSFVGAAGKIHLELEFIYSHHKYIDLFKSQDVKVDWYPLNPSLDAKVNHHWFYKSLLKAFLFNVSANNNRADTELLTPQAKWLLDEFGTRLGVREPFRNVLFLKYVDRILKPIAPHMTVINIILSEVIDNSFLTTRGEKIYQKAKEELVVTTVNFITSYRKNFPKNTPEGMIELLLDTLRLFEKSEVLVLVDKVTSCIKSATRTNYDRLKSNELPVTEINLLSLCEKMKSDGQEEIYYKKSFDRAGINFHELVVTSMYGYLHSDVKKYCETTQYTNTKVFDLFLKLRTFLNDPFYGPILNSSNIIMDLEDLFSSFIFGWFKDMKFSLQKYIKNEKNSESHSVKDLFAEFKRSDAFLTHLELQKPFYRLQFVEIITQICIEYLNTLYSTVKSQLETSASPYTVTPEVCMVFSNAELARTKMNSISENSGEISKSRDLEGQVLRDQVKQCYQSVFSHIKKNFDIFVDLINNKIVHQLFIIIHDNLNLIAKQNTVSDNKSMQGYINSQVEVISKTLNEELSKEWLTRLWKNILNKFNEYLISDNFSPNRLQAQAVGSMVEVLSGIFSGARKGVPNQVLDESTETINHMVELWQKATGSLIDYYLHNSNKKTSGETIGKDYVLHVLKCRSGYDKEAKAFCQEIDWSLHNFEKYDELRKIREHFGLAETEQILERLSCQLSEPKKKEGVLLVTSNSLCFDDKMEGPKGESIVIKLREITELKKSKVKLVFDALLLSTHDSKWIFYDFEKRDRALKEIYDQTVSIGNSNFKTE